MRKTRQILVAAVFVALSAGPAAAQGTQIGFKGGVQWADLTDDLSTGLFGATVETSTRLAWGFGGFFTYSFSPRFAIQPELMWTAKGAELGNNGDELRIQYAEIPLQLRLQAGVPMSGFRPYAMAGPYAAFEISCDFEREQNGTTSTQECAADTRNSTLFGVAAALGFEIPVGDLAAVLLEGRFSRDLGSVFDEDVAGDIDAKNQTFGIFAGLTVPLRGAGY